MDKLCTAPEKIIFLIVFVLLLNLNSFSQGGRVQLIHNSPDAGNTLLDVYKDDVLLVDNFGFRQATPYMDVEVSVPVKYSLAPAGSAGSQEAIQEFNITFGPGTKNILMITGLSGTGYAVNPNGRNTDLNMVHLPAAKDLSTNPAQVEINVIGGATDLEVFDILIDGGGGTLANNIGYGDYGQYLPMNPGEYVLQLSNYDNSTIIDTYNIDLTPHAGKGLLIFASGFRFPDNNHNGQALDLLAAFPDGLVVTLSEVGTTGGLFSQRQSFTSVTAWPVPARDVLNLELINDRVESVALEILTIYGQVIRQESDLLLINGINEIQLDLSGLTRGEYILRIIGSQKNAAMRLPVIE